LTLTVDGMMRNATQGQKANVAATLRADQAAGAPDVGGGVSQQVNATSVQLSVYGLIKSSFAEVQSAGQSLSMAGKASTTEDSTKAVQSFADAYNNAAKTVSAAAQSGTDAQVNLAAVDLGRVVSSGNNAADLKRAGVNVAQDGTLSVDTQTLQGALQINPDAVLATLTQVGAQAAQVAGNVLSGNIGSGSGTTPGGVTSGSNQQRSKGVAKGAIQQQAAAASGSVSGAIATYRQLSVF
jgi:hypothetical protein